MKRDLGVTLDKSKKELKSGERRENPNLEKTTEGRQGFEIKPLGLGLLTLLLGMLTTGHCRDPCYTLH